MPMPDNIHGLVAEFGSAKALFKAAEQTRDAGFKKWDVHSPFPIHGMDAAMGLRRSVLSWIVFCGGATGTLTAFLLQMWTQVWHYPTIVQAKPENIFTIPAFFPVIFELTILFAAFSAFFGQFILNMLPRFHHPLFNWDEFGRFSDDAFFLAIEAHDPRFSEETTRKFLEEIGASQVCLVEDDD